MKRRLSILERSSMQVGGHERTQLRALRQMAQGVELAMITHTEFIPDDVTEGIEVNALLQPRGVRKRMSPSKVSGIEVAALSKYFEGLPTELRHLILVPAVTLFDIRLLLTLAKTEFVRTPRLAGRLMRLQTVASLSAVEISELAELCRAHRLFLYTETAEMGLQIQSRFGVPVAGAMLLPCMIEPDGENNANALAPTEKNAWSVAFFGNPRDEKGSEQQPLILSSLREAVGRQSSRKPIRVLAQGHRLSKLQAAKVKHNYKMMREAAINRLRPSGLSIQLAFNSISADHFLGYLNDADLLVLPYLTPPYDTAGSGLVIDGVLAGKAILHTAGMAMNEFLNCGNAESAGSPEEFGSLIVKMLMQLDSYSAGKVEARKRVLRALEMTSTQVKELLEA